jgi:uncharacterized membrane protein
MTYLNYLFAFFVLGVTGWLLESVQETIVRRQLVNKGFFKGPFTLSHAIGGMGVYLVGSPFRAHPAAAFLAGMIVCTAVEYVMAVFLDKCFKVKCWDYTTYPHTKWCHFQGRICLTISLFFGVTTLFLVYVYWDFIQDAARRLGSRLFWVDSALVLLFAVDAVTTCVKLLIYKKKGIHSKSYAVFTDVSDLGNGKAGEY